MALSHSQKIETSIEDNWPDAADSPRALRAQVRALTAQLATARDAVTELTQENEILREQLSSANRLLVSVATR